MKAIGGWEMQGMCFLSVKARPMRPFQSAVVFLTGWSLVLRSGRCCFWATAWLQQLCVCISERKWVRMDACSALRSLKTNSFLPMFWVWTAGLRFLFAFEKGWHVRRTHQQWFLCFCRCGFGLYGCHRRCIPLLPHHGRHYGTVLFWCCPLFLFHSLAFTSLCSPLSQSSLTHHAHALIAYTWMTGWPTVYIGCGCACSGWISFSLSAHPSSICGYHCYYPRLGLWILCFNLPGILFLCFTIWLIKLSARNPRLPSHRWAQICGCCCLASSHCFILHHCWHRFASLFGAVEAWVWVWGEEVECKKKERKDGS